MGQHQKHQNQSIYTQQELQLLAQAKERSVFSAHHHHHHHSNVKYQKPKQLTTSIALYSLKKLNAMEPKFLTCQQKRLLGPVAPGFLSYVVHAGFIVSFSAYAFYIFKGFGVKGFTSKAVIPLVGIWGAMQATQYGIAYLREYQFEIQRNNLVRKYLGKYGESYLLDALNPSFRI